MDNSLPSLVDTLKKAGIVPNRRLGQHFLLDQHITDRIAHAAGNLTAATVIEIGPGPGGLTRSLLDAHAKQVIAIELDPRCEPILQELKACYGEKFDYIMEDALKLPLHNLGTSPRKIVANLPYNVATPILLNCLRNIHDFTSLTVMLQKEVANRLTAKPKTSAYGRLAIITQWRAQVAHLFDVSPQAFTPPPKVESTVVQIKQREKFAQDIEWAALETITKIAFQKRRKMLRATLKVLFPQTLLAVLRDLDIAPTARAEELTVDQFCDLARAYSNRT